LNISVKALVLSVIPKMSLEAEILRETMQDFLVDALTESIETIDFWTDECHETTKKMRRRCGSSKAKSSCRKLWASADVAKMNVLGKTRLIKNLKCGGWTKVWILPRAKCPNDLFVRSNFDGLNDSGSRSGYFERDFKVPMRLGPPRSLVLHA